MQDLQWKLAMSLDNSSLCSPNVEHVIDRCPLRVTPDTLVIDVISLMGRVRSNCLVDGFNLMPDYKAILGEAGADCVLVMQDFQLLGIFTERDVVRLTAFERNLERVTIGSVMTKPVITLCISEFRDVFTALSRLRSLRIRHLPIVNQQGDLVGVVSHETIRSCLQPPNLLKIRTVASVMSTTVIAASARTSILSLAQLMAQHQVSCVVIAQAKGQETPQLPIPIGIVTERDIVHCQTLGLDLTQTVAQDIMSSPLFCVTPEDSLLSVDREMQRRHVRRLVVCGTQGELKGIVTQTSLLQAFDCVEMCGTIDLLQHVVEERTADLRNANEQLQQQIIERQQAESARYLAEAQYQTIFENAVEGIFQTTPNGRYKKANPALARIYGYNSPAQLMSAINNISSQLYVDPNRRAEFIRLLQVQDTVSNFESQVFTRDRSVIWISEKARAVRDVKGNLLYYEGFVEEITARKQAEAEILKALAQEKELNQLKAEFVSMISHDFRSPLTSIRLASEFLQCYSDQLTEEKKLTYFQSIRCAINQMVQLLNEILLIGKADSGRLHCQPAPLDLKLFCHELVEELQISAGEQYQIVFTAKGKLNDTVMDKSLLRHIFGNLLSNAIKYSPEGGTVRFELTCQNKAAVFRIQDQGIGIPPKDQKRLFQLFNRAKNVGNIPGTGLGLAIVKRCVEAHCGKISVASKVGVGTTFTVMLPLKSKPV